MASNVHPRRHLEVLSLSILACLAFSVLELIKFQRIYGWCGGDFQGWAGVLLGFGIYLALVWGVAELALAVVRMASRQRDWMPVVAVWFSSSLVWSAVCAGGGNVRLATIVCMPVLLCVCFVGAGWRRGARLNRYIALALCFLACGAAQTALGELLFLSPHRLLYATPAALAYGLLSGLLLLWMRSRSWRVRFVCAVLMLGLPFSVFALRFAPARAHNGAPPNLVLITCDALRADFCSVYGGTTPTPALESLAQTGRLYASSYSLAPWTLPSMVGLFSSSYPPGVAPHSEPAQAIRALTRNRIPDETPTLAELLAARGYRTGGFSGNPLLQGPNGVFRGFQASAAFYNRATAKNGPVAPSPHIAGSGGPLLAGDRPRASIRHYAHPHPVRPAFHPAQRPPAVFSLGSLHGPPHAVGSSREVSLDGGASAGVLRCRSSLGLEFFFPSAGIQ